MNRASLTYCMLGNFSCFWCRLQTFFFKRNVFKNSFRKAIRMSNGLDPGQDRHSVGPDLGLSCLKRLSEDDIEKATNRKERNRKREFTSMRNICSSRILMRKKSPSKILNFKKIQILKLAVCQQTLNKMKFKWSIVLRLCLFVCFDSLRPSQQFFSHVGKGWARTFVFVWFDSLSPSQQFLCYVGTGLPGLNQY